MEFSYILHGVLGVRQVNTKNY